jgi:hypothetical protein
MLRTLTCGRAVRCALHIHVQVAVFIDGCCSCSCPWLQDSAEFGRIGRYYAAESMLVWDEKRQVSRCCCQCVLGGLAARREVLLGCAGVARLFACSARAPGCLLVPARLLQHSSQ